MVLVQLYQSICVFIPLALFHSPPPLPSTRTPAPYVLQIYSYILIKKTLSQLKSILIKWAQKKRSSHQEGSRLKLNISTNLCYKRREISHTHTHIHKLSFLLFSPHSNRILSPSVSPSSFLLHLFPSCHPGGRLPSDGNSPVCIYLWVSPLLCVPVCACVPHCTPLCLHHYLCVCVCLCGWVRSSYYYGSSCSGIAGDCGRCADRTEALKGFTFEWQSRLKMLHCAESA